MGFDKTSYQKTYMKSYRVTQNEKIEKLKAHMKEIDPEFYNSLFPQ